MNELSFRLMKEFPNEAYLDVYHKYYPRNFYFAIWENQCEAYSKLKNQVEKEVQEYEKHKILLPPVEPIDFPEDTSSEKIRW